MARLNTQLEAESAEFFVLANLLLNKIPSFKNYTRHAGYDLIATNLVSNKLVKIQVKSRYRLNAKGFPISNFDSDFVVFCKLNRSVKDGVKNEEPEYYIFPTALVKKNINTTSSWQKFYVTQIPDLQKYYMNWGLIKQALL